MPAAYRELATRRGLQPEPAVCPLAVPHHRAVRTGRDCSNTEPPRPRQMGSRPTGPSPRSQAKPTGRHPNKPGEAEAELNPGSELLQSPSFLVRLALILAVVTATGMH